MTYVDTRSAREKLQDEYIDRIIDGMDIGTLVQYVRDQLDEEFNELEDAELASNVAEVYPDLLENL